MTTTTKANQDYSLSERITKKLNENMPLRLLAEFLSSMLFIFFMNLVLALGEDNIPIFRFTSNYNVGNGIWIGFMTMVGFFWFQKTGIATNLINLTLKKMRGQIDGKTYWSSTVAQFAGGIFGALFVFFIAAQFVDLATDPMHAMGGTKPKIKGMINTNVSNEAMYKFWAVDGKVQTSFLNPWESYDLVENLYDTNRTFIYLFAAGQGLVNATWIVVAFILNSLVDDKSKNKTQQFALRYIILIVGISVTTIVYANTTNWVRILTPTIVNVFNDLNKGTVAYHHSIMVLETTMIYISMQMIGVIFVYFEVVWEDSIGAKQKEFAKNEQKEIRI